MVRPPRSVGLAAVHASVLCIRTQPISATSGCTTIDGSRKQWFTVHDGDVTPVSDPMTVRRAWYGDRTLEYHCGGEVVLTPYCEDAQTRPEPIDLYVGRTFVDSGKLLRDRRRRAGALAPLAGRIRYPEPRTNHREAERDTCHVR